MPDISGNTRIATASAALGAYYAEGAFWAKGNNLVGAPNAAGMQNISDLGFAASLSSSIYGNSLTVQPSALYIQYLIKY